VKPAFAAGRCAAAQKAILFAFHAGFGAFHAGSLLFDRAFWYTQVGMLRGGVCLPHTAEKEVPYETAKTVPPGSSGPAFRRNAAEPVRARMGGCRPVRQSRHTAAGRRERHQLYSFQQHDDRPGKGRAFFIPDHGRHARCKRGIPCRQPSAHRHRHRLRPAHPLGTRRGRGAAQRGRPGGQQ
jgi:hypothetical protein